MTKVSLYRSLYLAKPTVLLLAPTGIAPINSNDNTINSGLHTPSPGKLLLFNDLNEAELRSNYSEVELVITDEISIVSSKLFYQVHKRLNEMFTPG